MRRVEEISEAMFQQTNSVLPNALKGALQGKVQKQRIDL